MRRLGVFIFYDPQGMVDDYILFLLSEMRSVCTEIVTICNGGLTEAGKNSLARYSQTICCRDNHGMDAGALKDYFTKFGRREDWAAYDELVWFNDTCYGPLYAIEKVFKEMEREPCDFWGITVHAASNAKWAGSKRTGIPAHIQSYFLVIKQPLLQDECFFRFWKEIEISDKFNDTVANYELALTQTFSSHGYRYAVFCDTRDRDNNPDCVCNPTAEAMYELVNRYACPFIKRKNFLRTWDEALVHTNGEQVLRTMAYIQENTQYDLRMIYQNLSRRYDQQQWRRHLCLSRSVSARHSDAGYTPPPSLIVAELNHEDTVRELAEQLTALPPGCTLRILTHKAALSATIRDALPPCEVVVLDGEKEGLAVLFSHLVSADYQAYAYICLLQELWGRPGNGMHVSESSIRFTMYGNLVAGTHFIRNTLQLFDDEKTLGVLTPPLFPQSRENAPKKTPKAYAEQYKLTLPCRVSDRLSIRCISLWCRREIVSAVLEHLGDKIDDVEGEALECLLTSIAVSRGYLSAELTESRQTACLQGIHASLVDLVYESPTELHWMSYRRLFQKAVAINTGKLDPDHAGISVSQMFRLLLVTGLFFVEKKVRKSIPKEKKSAFFLGFRDVFQAYRRLLSAKYRRRNQ